MTDCLSEKFRQSHADSCAFVVLTSRQKIFYLAAAAAMLLLLIYRWDIFVFVTAGILSFWYASSALFRITAAVRGYFFCYDNFAPCADVDLPVYTILLPMYHEANIAPGIVRRMLELDYPVEKLDVKILLEHDDSSTLAAMNDLALPENFQVMIMDDATPRTKPRACNYGLREARGEFCVIYDAEDRPEPDQLRKSVAAFRADTTGKVACIQAKLNYHNQSYNLLTRLFTIEYSTHFDLLLPGMQKAAFPLPLGGTSNHFRTADLRRIGGWDPFNVTEDCDLGVRIYESGYRTQLLDSTTWEEANSQWGNWLRQRSRWVKGFLQTHFVHYRSWARTVERLGWRGAFGGYLAIGGGAMMLLGNLFFIVLIAIYLVLLALGVSQGVGIWTQIVAPQPDGTPFYGINPGFGVLRAWPLLYAGEGENILLAGLSWLFAAVAVFLFLANFVFVFIGMLGCLKRKYYSLLPFTLLLPFYWLLMSVAAWKGFLQLFYKPYYWEKTKHGLTGND